MTDATLSLTEYDAWHRENPMSRFSGPASEALWNASLDSYQDEETGDVETTGWFALFIFTGPEEAKQFFCHGRKGAILCQDAQGFVSCYTYKTKKETRRAWKGLTEWTEKETEGDE